MKKSLFLSLVFFCLLILAARFSYTPLTEALGAASKAGIKITSLPQATVFIDGQEVGKTPYEDQDSKAEEYLIKLQAGEATWQDRVKLTAGTLTVVNREITPNVASSSGEVLTLHPGKGVVITSTPSEAEVEVDGKSMGKTPLSITDLPFGEHTFLLSQENYLKRSIRATLPENLSLYIDVNLALSEVNLGAQTPPVIVPSITLVVKATPLGFLRVRDKPSLLGAEVGKISTGETLTQLEELSGWVRVRLGNGAEGYVSTQYIKKSPNYPPR